MATFNRAIFTFLLLFLISGGQSYVIFKYQNSCTYSLWLASSPSIGEFSAERGPGVEEIFSTPDTWTGSIWVRTKCSYDPSYNFTCETGDCGAGVDCQGPPPTYPVTLLNFDISQSVVSYELSLNHGFNVPIRIEPVGGTLVDGSGPCPVVDCARDIGDVCPAPLVATNKNGAYVGCNSACDALKDPQSCCTGDFAGAACQPNDNSKRFKDLCNMAHTYPGDNNPPVYKCSGATNYIIRFCP